MTGPLPPSYNHAFKRDRFGNNIPTSELVRWEAEFKEAVLKQTPQSKLRQFSDISETSTFTIRVCVFMNLINQTYPAQAKSYLKKVDADNRGKLVQDLVCRLLGFDDKHIFTSIQEKRHDQNKLRVEVTLWETSKSYGLPQTIILDKRNTL